MTQSSAPFPKFCAGVRELLDETAADKGYHQGGLTGPNPMYAFVAETAGGRLSTGV